MHFGLTTCLICNLYCEIYFAYHEFYLICKSIQRKKTNKISLQKAYIVLNFSAINVSWFYLLLLQLLEKVYFSNELKIIGSYYYILFKKHTNS